MTIKAKEILDGKFWILEDSGVKIATLSLSDDKYILSDKEGTRFVKNAQQIEKSFGKIDWSKLEITEIMGRRASCIVVAC